MHSCQTFGQIPASSPFSVTRFRIKGKLWTELVTEASSGGPQSIPATNPPCPNSRSSSALSPPYIPRAPTTPHFFLSDHQGRWYLPSASPSSAWHSLLVSTKRFDNCCHNRHPVPYGHYCYQPSWQWKHRTWSSRTHCHLPPGDVFKAPPPPPPSHRGHTQRDVWACQIWLVSPQPVGDQLTALSPTTQQQSWWLNVNKGVWMPSMCLWTPHIPEQGVCMVNTWSAGLQAEDVSPHSLHHLTHQTPLEKVYLSCLHNLIVCSSDSVVTSSYVPIFPSQL